MTTAAHARKDAAVVALDLVEDIAEGRVRVAELDAELAEQCRALVGIVVGPGDPLYELQIDIARQVIASGGLTADEVAEWHTVLRRRAAGDPALSLVSENPPPEEKTSDS